MRELVGPAKRESRFDARGSLAKPKDADCSVGLTRLTHGSRFLATEDDRSGC